jgi:prepilin-type processing-associated H-X9-DG protein
MSLLINDPKRVGTSSKHPGGANVGMVDGKSRWAQYSVAPGNHKAILTIAGGEGIAIDHALGDK